MEGLERILVFKHSLKSIWDDLARSKCLTYDLVDWLGEVMQQLEDLEEEMEIPMQERGGPWATLHRVHAILELIQKDLETNEIFLSKVCNQAPHQSAGALHAEACADVDFAAFDDLSDAELRQECARQQEIAAAALREGAIAKEALIRRLKAAA